MDELGELEGRIYESMNWRGDGLDSWITGRRDGRIHKITGLLDLRIHRLLDGRMEEFIDYWITGFNNS